MFYITGLLNHLKRVQAWVVDVGGEASLNARDLSLTVTVGCQSRQLLPQFSQWRDGRRFYTPIFSADVRAFTGWRPHGPRRWPSTADKLVFKEHAHAAGVRVPQGWKEPSADVRQFLVKQVRSSFGEGIRGPFERIDSDNPLHVLKPGEYFEAFVPGRIAKGWYLNGELLGLEVRPPPSVEGDGRTTLRALAAKRHPPPVDERALGWMVAAQGWRLDDVLPEGRRVVVDFKYGSPFDDWSFENENVLTAVRDSSIGTQLVQAGPALLGAIPPDMRYDTLITLDAVVDVDDTVWFLELNSNPMVHPDTYAAMLRQAFLPAPSLAAAAVP